MDSEENFEVIEESSVRYRKPVSALQVWLSFATMLAKRSPAPDKQVGCVAVDMKGNVIGYGYNHSVDENDPCTVDHEGKTRDVTLHAEEETIQRAAEMGRSLEGCTLFLTHSPCLRCAARLIRARIKKIYYISSFKNGVSHDFLLNHGVDLIQVCGVSEEADFLIQEQEDLEDHIDSITPHELSHPNEELEKTSSE
jgi:dCMP deaminase